MSGDAFPVPEKAAAGGIRHVHSTGSMPGLEMKLVFGNLWLFGPLLKAVMPSLSAQAGAMLKTTIAFTVQKGSDAYNVLPRRLMWVPTCVLFLIREKRRAWRSSKSSGKYGLETEVLHANDYTPPVDIHGEAFHLVEQTIADTFRTALQPYVMTGDRCTVLSAYL